MEQLQERNRVRRLRVRLVPYDRITLKHKDDKTSLWEGERGTYVFENTGELAPRKPIRRVYLNRRYMSGLFTSRRQDEFSADLKGPEGKVYLVFRLVTPEMMEIFQKVPEVAAGDCGQV